MKTLVVLALLFCSYPLMAKDYYVVGNEQAAKNIISYINENAGLPWVYEKNGKPAPESTQTTEYCKASQRKDGKWIVPRIPREFRLKQKPAKIMAFMSQFNPTIQPYSKDWERIPPTLNIKD